MLNCNNHDSFHLRWKENLVKQQKISKSFDQDCSRYVLLEKDLLEKDAAIKRFEYSSLRSDLKKQVDIVEKQYQGLNKFFKPDKIEKPIKIKKEESVTIKKE